MEIARSAPTLFRRLGARMVDGFLFGVFFIPFWLQTGFAQSWNSGVLVLFLKLLLMQMVFEAALLALFQRTPGKWLFSLRLVSQSDGAVPTFVQCLIRVVTCNFSLFLGWSLYAFAFIRLDRTHPADWLAGTRLVQEHDAKIYHAPPQRKILYALIGIFILGPLFATIY